MNISEDLAFIIAKFSAGVLIGVAIGILWLCVLSFLRKEEFMYIATIGYILKCYVIPETLGGSGALRVPALGIILENDSLMASDRATITGMYALGLTQALLSFIPSQYNLPNAHLYRLVISVITSFLTSKCRDRNSVIKT